MTSAPPATTDQRAPTSERGLVRLPHLPALDGLRGFALVAVLLYHTGFSWARGGYLAVTTFFVLSGFLITSLLLVERERHGRITLRTFWARRARRLAPAMLLMVGLVIAYAGSLRYPPSELVGDAVGTLTWVANWRFIFSHQSYGALFGQPSPLQHTWSLAVEEQFYLVLPIAAVLLLGRRGNARRKRFAAVVVAGVVASTIAAALLHPSGALPGRAYFGTDARVAEPLVGVLLALLFVNARGLRQLTGWSRRALTATGFAGTVGLIVLYSQFGEHSDALYRGGFLVAALASAAVVAAGAQRGTLFERAFTNAPMVALGRISYGVYLFHWPVFLWLSPPRTDLAPWPLFFLRTTVTLALATVSYFLVEQPIRNGHLPGRVALVGWANASVALVAGMLVVTTVPTADVATLLNGSGGGAPPPPPVVATSDRPSASVSASAALPSSPPPPVLTTPTAPPPTTAGKAPTRSNTAAPAPSGGANGPPTTPTTPTTPPTTAVPPVRIAVVGDSMADGLAAGLDAWAKGHNAVVYDLGQPGCPLARGGVRRLPDGRYLDVPDYCSWWADSSSDNWQNLLTFSPDVVVMQDGMNEAVDRKLPSWSTWRGPGDPQYDSWLLSEYRQAIGAFASHYPVLFLNATCADWNIYDQGTWTSWSDGEGDQRVAALNRTDSAATAATGVNAGDLYGHLCPNGHYSSTVDGVEGGRPDGYHLSSAASEAVAEHWLGPLAVAKSRPG